MKRKMKMRKRKKRLKTRINYHHLDFKRKVEKTDSSVLEKKCGTHTMKLNWTAS